MRTIKIYLKPEKTRLLKTHTTATGEVVTLETKRVVPVPSKKNQQQPIINHKTGKAFLKHSDQYINWQRLTKPFWEAQAWKLSGEGVNLPIVRCKVKIIFYFGDEQDRDCTNKAETIMDALVEHQILADDNFKVVSEVSLMGLLCRDKPRTEIYLSILSPADPGYEYDKTDQAEYHQMKKERSAKRYQFSKKVKQ